LRRNARAAKLGRSFCHDAHRPHTAEFYELTDSSFGPAQLRS
jgi:hypothetical protein